MRRPGQPNMFGWQYSLANLEAIAHAADTSLPTLYRLFSSKRTILQAVLDVSFSGDDQPIAFGDRPEVQAALSQPHAIALIRAFAHIVREFMDRSSAIMHVLATAAQVDAEAAQLMDEIRRQLCEGHSRIIAALSARATPWTETWNCPRPWTSRTSRFRPTFIACDGRARLDS